MWLRKGWFPVGADDRGFAAVAFNDDFVEVVRLGGVEGLDREVVNDQQVHGGDAPELGFERVVEAGGSEPGEEFVGAGEVHAHPAPDPGMAQGGGEVGFAHADRAQEEYGVPGFGERQGAQVREEHPVVA